MATIDIDGKKLAYSQNDLDLLTRPEGCRLEVINNKVHQLSDSLQTDESESEELLDEEKDESSRKFKEDRMKREFISLVLNANKDPIKPCTAFKYNNIENENFECDTSNLENKYMGIHRMYENMGKFDCYMKTNKFEEIVSGKVYKKVRRAGLRVPVNEESLIIYNCALWTEDSREPFDSTWLRQTTLSVNLRTDSILPGLHDLLLTTKEGELCEAFFAPEVAFGKLGARPRIPPNATIFCLLEIVKVVAFDKIASLMSQVRNENGCFKFEDVYEASDEARRRGNYFYDYKQYRIALHRYKSAIRLLDGLTCKDEYEQKQVNELLLKLFNNCARTANAMGNPRLALSACKQAAEIDDMVPKTYWHRMTAWTKKGHLDRALGVARRAMQLFSKDTAALRQFTKAADDLKQRIQKDEREVTELHKLMGRALLSSA